jgi:Domain of unknown function (DUF4304)
MAIDGIAELVRTILAPPLTAAGFTRRARVWNRRRGDIADVIELQASRWNEPGKQSFTVNLGLFAPSVYRTCWQKDPPSFLRSEDCILRRRLHAALGETGAGQPKEQWWNVHDAADVERIGGEVAGLLAARAVPFLNRIETLRALCECLEQSAGQEAETPLGRIYLAIAKAELGDLVSARSILSDVGATAPSAWRDRVRAVVDELSRRTSRRRAPSA